MPSPRCLLTILLTAALLPTAGQRRYRLHRLVDSLLTARYQRADIDTHYVTRPLTKWTVTGRYNMTGATLGTVGVENGRHFQAEVAADSKSTVSIGASYLGVSLNLSLNPAKLTGKYHDYELNLRSYGKRFGFDIAYLDARNFKGWYEDESMARVSLPADVLTLKTLNANTYYAFNHRRFSYPAAFANSYLQRRSAGSFLLALSGQWQQARTFGYIQSQLTVSNIGIGAGYGYNFVPGRGWLLHLSALPTFIVVSNTSFTSEGNKTPLHYHFPEVIITSRSAVVRQIGRNKFAGISMVFNYTNIGSAHNLSIRNTKWLARAYFGFRL